MESPAPVEYAVAVDLYLDQAPISGASRRVYRISCRVTGHARMSYRRAAEVFTALTRPLDTAGSGWTLHQLSAAGKERKAGQAMAPELRRPYLRRRKRMSRGG